MPCLLSATTLNLTGFEHSDKVDPFELVNKDLSDLGKRIKELLGVDHPVLETVAKCVKQSSLVCLDVLNMLHCIQVFL